MAARVLVPLDGTPAGEVVLARVAELARALQAEIILMHVVPPRRESERQSRTIRPPIGLFGAPSVLPDYSPSSTVLGYRYDPAEIESTRRYVERVAVWLQEEGLMASAVVVEGVDIAAAVVSAARDADWLAISATMNPSTLGRAVFGSTLERLLRESPIPILFVRVPDAEN
ncbi:MAG: universal stress protein [Chloroflexota bacterium]|nr:MAG: universal stress protein [Chloroflexota bacterium]